MFLGINVADTPREARDYVERYDWGWPSIRDPGRARARKLGADYQPHVIVIDEAGRIVASYEGGGDAPTWESLADHVS